MSLVKKIVLVIIILLFSIILYRLFERRRIIQKNMENNVMTEGYSGIMHQIQYIVILNRKLKM